ncbi:MAG TPA: trigger factor [Tepidisphaeraceae bacterium]|nr:trigger factor [Tepidisphaeraceae bacterium]
MAENEETGGTAVAEEKFEYPIKIEDAGPATKKVSVEIPADRIKSKLDEQFKELRREAAIPGFRPGHAPAKLIAKRFGDDVKDQVRRSLISESYAQAVEKNDLQVLGEPQFENEASISQLPDSGGLTYTFEIEVQPDITLPNLTGIQVKKPKIEVKDENVEQAMNNLREQQGTLIPVEDRGVQDKDYITADVHIKLDGNVVAHQHDAQLVARPARIGGIEVADFEKQIEGAKAGETKTITAKAPDNHPTEAIRGKDVQIEILVKDIKRLELVEITPEFLEDLGFSSEQELRDALREQMVERIDYDVAQAQREQVMKYLLDNTTFELPRKMSAKQVDRVVQRRAIDLLMRGVPREQVDAQLQHLRAGAVDEAARELKLFFILQKIANDQQTDVEEAELNGRIALLAAQRGARPEKLKQEMAKDGSLSNLYVQMREQKALDKILESATIEEVDVPNEPEKKE